MSGKYQAYPDYRKSGIDWIGDIPKNWSTSYLGFECSVKARLGWKGLKAEEYVDEGYAFLATPNIKNKEIDFVNVDRITKDRYDESPEIMLKEGDVLVTKDGSTTGTTNAVRTLPEPATVNSSIAVLRSKGNVESSFLFYFFTSDYTQNIINRMRGGMGVPHLFQADLKKFDILVPSKQEQQKIANFLDHETAKIDTLIEKQQQLIALLKEKRQTVISHAVTKGLNANAPMRDSGVEWLGEVPVHWGVSALKYHVDTVNGFGFSSSDVCEEGVPFIRAGNIKKKSVTRTNLYLPKGIVDRHKRVILSEGDIVISMVGSDPIILESAVGQIGIVPNSMAGSVPNQNVVILREKTDLLLKKFLFYALCSDSYRNHLNVFSHKLANQSIISSSLIVNAKFMLPSAEEQSEVIKFLDQRLTKFDEVMERNNYSLTLLKERRTALISAAVTGKIDVRSWIAPEPSDCKNKEAVG
jgi:type I restriction enzyme S subunit